MELSATKRVRLSIIGVVVVALFSALFARLWYLQVAAADQFQAAATENAVREINIPAGAGRILDAQGSVLAENRVENVITVTASSTTATSDRVLAPARADRRHSGAGAGRQDR